MSKKGQKVFTDKNYIQKLSCFIVDASMNMHKAMEDAIKNNSELQKRIKKMNVRMYT